MPDKIKKSSLHNLLCSRITLQYTTLHNAVHSMLQYEKLREDLFEVYYTSL